MICAWNSFLQILPEWLRSEVDQAGRETLNELRMRINSPPELVSVHGSQWLKRAVSQEDLQFCINTATRYSPWTAVGIGQGYITAAGGHRIGLCGDAVIHNGTMNGIRNLRSLNIRIARDFPGISSNIPLKRQSMLVLGAPGWGKTTLLRDLSRRIAERYTVSVVDERGELFPEHITCGKKMDILSGCPKAAGIEMLMKTMCPDYIVLDEISSEPDCEAIMNAVGCGVSFLASVHTGSSEDFQKRPLYRRLIERKVFSVYIVLNSTRSFRLEECSL